MTNQEYQQELYDIFTGILKNNETFAPGKVDRVEYDFTCPEYQVLKERYHLEEIAGKGSDFERGVRLLHHFAPRLKHKSDYDNHIPINALDLLEYGYEKPDVGINCLNKSKIPQECCMALGIYARRVSLMPYSIYDSDNHVVTEIFDRKRNKWIMLDCTTGGYFINGQGEPLSCLEIREHMKEQKPCSVIFRRQKKSDIDWLFRKNLEDNSYIAKNMVWFNVDKHSAFGRHGEVFYVAPVHFDPLKSRIDQMQFIVRNAEKFGLSEAFVKSYQKRIPDPNMVVELSDASALWSSPIQ